MLTLRILSIFRFFDFNIKSFKGNKYITKSIKINKPK